MKFSYRHLLGALLAATPAMAATESICDKYTIMFLKNNTAANQEGLITTLVNTIFIGNYTQPNTGIALPGILVPGKFQGQDVNLLPYFNGGLVSSNRNGTAVAINFLDDGAILALAETKPAYGTSSNQYHFLTHVYSYFGFLLGCSTYGNGFPVYGGVTSMYSVHKYMNLGPLETNYFIYQVQQAALSLGVTPEDVTAVIGTVNATFNARCAPAVAILPTETAELQAVCIQTSCTIAATSPDCSAYGTNVNPTTATSTPGPQASDLISQQSAVSAGDTTGAPVSTSVTVATTGASVATTGAGTASPSPANAAPIQTAGFGMIAVVGAGIVGQML